jgi:hypothetical protein
MAVVIAAHLFGHHRRRRRSATKTAHLQPLTIDTSTTEQFIATGGHNHHTSHTMRLLTDP